MLGDYCVLPKPPGFLFHQKCALSSPELLPSLAPLYLYDRMNSRNWFCRQAFRRNASFGRTSVHSPPRIPLGMRLSVTTLPRDAILMDCVENDIFHILSVPIMQTIVELTKPTGFPLTERFTTKRLIPATIVRGDALAVATGSDFLLSENSHAEQAE